MNQVQLMLLVGDLLLLVFVLRLDVPFLVQNTLNLVCLLQDLLLELFNLILELLSLH